MAWVLQQPGTRLTTEAMCWAAEKGDISICQYLHSQRCPWGACSTSGAASGGHLKLLRWLLYNGCKLCLAAAETGSVDMLIYLQHESWLSDAELLTQMLDEAGLYDHLAAAKWPREQGAE
jgi:hypothetical protein